MQLSLRPCLHAALTNKPLPSIHNIHPLLDTTTQPMPYPATSNLFDILAHEVTGGVGIEEEDGVAGVSMGERRGGKEMLADEGIQADPKMMLKGQSSNSVPELDGKKTKPSYLGLREATWSYSTEVIQATSAGKQSPLVAVPAVAAGAVPDVTSSNNAGNNGRVLGGFDATKAPQGFSSGKEPADLEVDQEVSRWRREKEEEEDEPEDEFKGAS